MRAEFSGARLLREERVLKMMLVDPRVGSEDLLQPLQRYGVPAQLAPANLESADFAFVGNGKDGDVYIGIELKETRDVVSCMYSNRFTSEQLPKLQRMYGHHAWLLTEGIWRAGNGGILESFTHKWYPVQIGARKVMADDLDSWILTQTIMGGLHHHHSATRTDTIRFLARLYHWWTDKMYADHRSQHAIYVPPPDRMLLTEPSQFLRMASCLPNVGWEKGRALETAHMRFQLLTPDGVPATAKDLTAIDGIGNTIAQKILTTLEKSA